MTSDDLNQINAFLQKGFKAQDEKFEKRLDILEENIAEDFAKILNDSIFPALSKTANKADIDRVDRRIDAVANQNGNHEVRIKDIESVPVVAHELKRTKKK